MLRKWHRLFTKGKIASPIQVAGNFFYFVATATKNFLFTFLLINFLSYGFNMWVVPLFLKLECFVWKCHPRRDVLTESRSDGYLSIGKSRSRKGDSTKFPVSGSVGNRNLKDTETQAEISITLSSPANSVSPAFLTARKLPDVFCDTICATLWTCVRELSFRTWETPLFRYNTNKRSYRGHLIATVLQKHHGEAGGEQGNL